MCSGRLERPNAGPDRFGYPEKKAGGRGPGPLAETIIGLCKAELIRRGPWKGIDQVEYCTLEYVDWFNQRRLLEPIDYVSPAEFEEAYRREHDPSYADGPQSRASDEPGAVQDATHRLSRPLAICADIRALPAHEMLIG
jgi:hypothetical protein